MKATLKFTLPEETEDHQLAVDGYKWHRVCHDLDNFLRSLEKHQDIEEISVSGVRDKLRDICSDNGLQLWS